VILAGAVLLPAWRETTAARAGGTIVGTVSTNEAARPPLRVAIDENVCGTTVPNESIVVDARGGLAGAVVTVAGLKTAAPAETTVANEKCRFVPHVAIVRPAGTVKVTNKDPQPVLHTTHAQQRVPDGKGKVLFNVGLPIPNMTLSKTVDKAGVVDLVCNTHTWMRGYLYVTEELSAISGADGAFRLEGVPAGTYELRVWHEVLKSAPVKVTVKEGESATVAFTMTK
jgi:plastocyanin